MKEITDRRSIRKFKDLPVAPDLIKELVEAARLAPSGHNLQPWKFLSFTGDKKDRLLDVLEKGFKREKGEDKFLKSLSKGFPFATHTLRVLRATPVVIVVLCTDCKNLGEQMDVCDQNKMIISLMSVGAAIQNLLLEAVEKGLGTLWVGSHFYAYPEIKEFLGTDSLIASLIGVGYPDENPAPRPRKNIEDIFSF